MLSVQLALRMSRTDFSIFLGIGSELLRAREAERCRWPGNPLREHRRKIEAELARMERDIATVRTLLAEAAAPDGSVPASLPPPTPALTA